VQGAKFQKIALEGLDNTFGAVGFYEMSRRRELGLGTYWIDIFDLRNSPSLPSILLLGFALLTFFICWQAAAEWLYIWLFGPSAPESLYAFFIEVFTTSQGWTLIILGHAIGFVFAVTVLSISVVLIPLAPRSRCGRRARILVGNPNSAPMCNIGK
jgi:uncharacterized membrane protein